MSDTENSKDLRFGIKDGRLVISLPFNEDGIPSASGKTKVVATTRGNKPVTINGKEFFVGVNAYKY